MEERDKKYQGPVKFYTKDDDIVNWLRNLEMIMKHEQKNEKN